MDKKFFSRRELLAGFGVTGAALGLSALTSCTSQPQTCDPAEHKVKALNLSKGNDPELFPTIKDGKYVAKDFSYLTKDSKLGLSPEIVENHLGLYKKYVDKVNKSEAMMAAGEIDEFSMKNLAFSLNGMALHDNYFSNMITDMTEPSTALVKAIEETFGSTESYFKNLFELADQVTGWSITAVNLLNGKIFNYATNDHSANYPNFVMPLIALDVYDHAFVMDFGKDGKRAYYDVFVKALNWDLVSRRYEAYKTVFS